MSVSYDELREARLSKIDPDWREFLETVPPLPEIGVSGLRAVFEATVGGIPATPGVSMRDVTVEGPHGDIPVRIYEPDGAQGPLGVYLHLHAGGFVAGGGLDVWIGENTRIAAAARCVVVAPDFKLPPEHKFPIGQEECWAVLNWVAEHAAEQGWDGGRLAIGGGCTGGNLSAVMALKARDAGGPNLRFQLLWAFPADGHCDTESQRENANGYGLRYVDNKFVFEQYLNPDDDINDWRISPLLAPSLEGVAPAAVVVGEWDILRDEDLAYAERLREAGVPVDVHLLPDQGHMPAPEGREAFHQQLAGLIREKIGS